MACGPEFDECLTGSGIKLEDYEKLDVDDLLRIAMWKAFLRFQTRNRMAMDRVERAQTELALSEPSPEFWAAFNDSQEFMADRMLEFSVRMSNFLMGHGFIDGDEDDDEAEELEA